MVDERKSGSKSKVPAMSVEQYDNWLRDLTEKITSIQKSRRGKYATEDNVMFNFDLSAEINQRTPPEEIMTLVTKHFLALALAVNGKSFYRWAWTTPDGAEGTKQVIADMQIYLNILFVAMERQAEAVTDAQLEAIESGERMREWLSDYHQRREAGEILRQEFIDGVRKKNREYWDKVRAANHESEESTRSPDKPGQGFVDICETNCQFENDQQEER